MKSAQADETTFTIGRLAKSAHVSADSIRFYEREGLLRPAGKTPSGYRLYTAEAVRRLAFIRHAQECGFALAEIRELLDLRSDTQSCCDDIYRLSLEKKLKLEGKIRALTAMSRALTDLMERCSHDRTSLDECPILGALEAGIGANRRPRPRTRSTTI